MGVIGALLLAQAVAASAGPATAPPETVQQAFERASALDATGTPAARIAAWRALGERVKGNRRTIAIAHAREGAALAAAGRRDEAETLTRAALADLPADDPTLRDYRYDATALLATGAEADFDYAGAAQRFAAAEAIAQTPADRFVALLGIVRTATYADPAAADAAVGRAEALLRSVKADTVVEGTLRRYQAELLLNRGDSPGPGGWRRSR